MQRRIYRPLSLAELRRLGAEGDLAPAPFTAYAVTADLRRAHPAADEEELEFLAFTDAAGSGPVRVVAAADVDEEQVSELLDAALAGSAVRVAVALPRRQVVSFHVADPTPGAPDAVGATGIPAFSWYDATELDVVVDLLS